jgi:hypothetical protein
MQAERDGRARQRVDYSPPYLKRQDCAVFIVVSALGRPTAMGTGNVRQLSLSNGISA